MVIGVGVSELQDLHNCLLNIKLIPIMVHSFIWWFDADNFSVKVASTRLISLSSIEAYTDI